MKKIVLLSAALVATEAFAHPDGDLGHFLTEPDHVLATAAIGVVLVALVARRTLARRRK